MKRFHVHVAVADIPSSIRFYSAMFGTEPAVTQPDYAKWMLEDPRVNFAISSRGHVPGVNHMGLQVDSEEELAVLRERTARAEIAALDQPEAACCYARSNKYWTPDPQGIAWETYHTLGAIPVFGEDTERAASPAQAPASEVVSSGACCIPLAKQAEATATSACCISSPAVQSDIVPDASKRSSAGC